MTTLINSRYSYDDTGRAPSNLIVDEPHHVPQLGARLIVAREGVFYTDEFSIRPANGGAPLVLNTDYHYVSLDADITAATGLETGTAVEIDNANVYGEYLVTMHIVGGVEGNSNALIEDLIAAIAIAKDTPVDWNKIIGIPVQFPPSEHLHSVTGLTELELVSQAIKGLELALTDSRPLQASGLNLHWQDERILQLITVLTNRLNQLYFDFYEFKRLLDAKHEIQWSPDVLEFLGNHAEDTDLSLPITAHSNLGDEFVNYNVTGGAFPSFLSVDNLNGLLIGHVKSSNYTESFSFRIRADDGFNAIARWFTVSLLGIYDGFFDISDVVDCGFIATPVVPGPDDELVVDTIDCGLVASNWTGFVEGDIVNCGDISGPNIGIPTDIIFIDTVDLGTASPSLLEVTNGDLVDCTYIGAVPIGVVGKILAFDTVDCGTLF